MIYKSDSYEYIKTIKNAHNDNIKGFVEFKNGLIASFSEDKTIKIWSFWIVKLIFLKNINFNLLYNISKFNIIDFLLII